MIYGEDLEILAVIPRNLQPLEVASGWAGGLGLA